MRALLIQKDTKHEKVIKMLDTSLRALLIQKDTKPCICDNITFFCLRALLIQKDTKLDIDFISRILV